MAGEGHDGIDAMIAAAQQQFPGHRFELVDGPGRPQRPRPLRVGARRRRRRRSVAAGVDFATVADDGRLRAVTGFLEPAADAPSS